MVSCQKYEEYDDNGNIVREYFFPQDGGPYEIVLSDTNQVEAVNGDTVVKPWWKFWG